MSGYSAGGKLAGVTTEELREAIEKYVADADHGRYPRTILVGLGGTGAKAMQHLRRMLVERFGRVELPGVAWLSVDTDIQSARPSATSERTPYQDLISFGESERINVTADVQTILGNLARHPHVREWWDDTAIDSRRSFELNKGAGQIRPLSRLCFFQNRELLQEALERSWGQVTAQGLDSARISEAKPRVIVIAGWAGGTGSGMFLDLAALIKHAFSRREYELEGYFVLPGVFRGADTKKGKLFANGFAALREANHYLSHPFEAQWDHHAQVEAKGLYGRYVLISGTNAAGDRMDHDSDAYKAIGEALFLDFAGGPIKSWVEGVRVNREQYLTSFVGYHYMVEDAAGRSRRTHADEFRTAFSSFGISKLVYPSWRLLNYAKYDLAAEMVRLLDPGRAGNLGDVITQWRSRFMVDAGFYQGVRVDEEGRQTRSYMVRDALARQPGNRVSSGSVYEHIVELGDELRGLADEMFHEKSSLELGKDHFRHVRKLLGDPYSPGSEGDWALQIVANREAFVRQVRADLDRVIEDYRDKRGVGITGVKQILESCLEELKRPWDKAMFGDWLRHQREEKRQDAEERKAEWEKLLNNADEASKGIIGDFGASPDNHKRALDMAADAFVQYWRSRVTEYICFEGIKALDGVAKALTDQLARIEQIMERMKSLEGFYSSFRDSFSEPVSSTMFVEIPVQEDLGRLLEPYLGNDQEQRREKLERLLAQTLRKIDVRTLAQLEHNLSGQVDRFRERIANEAFFALKGDDNGRTHAFVDDTEEPQVGFLERYSILRALEKLPKSEVEDYLKRMYRLGLPWVKANPEDPTGGAALKPIADAFFGVPDMGSRVGEDLFKELCRLQPHDLPFKPQKVGTNDPSELVFYTEWNAFAAYFVAESREMYEHYDKMLYDPVKPAALHIHTDFHTFQELLPLEEKQVQEKLRAWRLFHQAQMLGVICTRRRRRGDDTRVSYTRQVQSSALDTVWEELGVEATVIRNLCSSMPLVQDMTRQIERRIAELREAGGDYGDLVALADYWSYCVYPVINAEEQSGASVVEARGSLQNLAVQEIRKEWLAKARAEGLSAEAIDSRRVSRMRGLADWARPIWKSLGLPVPWSEDVPDELRVAHWRLLPVVREQSAELVRRGEVHEHRDESGALSSRFVRLGLRWDAFKPPEDMPAFAAEGAETFWYKGPTGQLRDQTAEQIAALVQANPQARHRVFATGWKGWKDAHELAGVRSALQAAPVEELPPPDDDEAVYHYACDGARAGKLSAAEVAQAVSARPDSEHKVWTRAFGSAWKLAADVPVIAALLQADEPPPLDEDEPPPL